MDNNFKKKIITFKKKKNIDNSINETTNKSLINNIENETNKTELIIKLLTFYIPTNFQKLIGNYYVTFHILIMVIGLSIVLFSNKIIYLLVVLLIICLDGIANILFQDCPLSTLEKKYLGLSMSEVKSIIYKKLGINYKCNHIFETQLEIIINVGCAIVLKILIIIFCDIFNINISSK